MDSSSVFTTCPYCGVGCGVQLEWTTASVTVSGLDDHPANLGRLCSKGTALAETLELPDRLLYPHVGGRRVSWGQAVATVAERFRAAITRHGPDSVAFYVSGQLLTEDYYVANKLMKGFIGSANIDTNSRLCMSSAVAAHKRAFGEDLVPGCYEDIEQAEMVVLAGSNTAWCHPVLFRRLQAARERNPDLYVVAIDPRRTYTASSADLHLALAPGSDAVLWNGLLVYLAEQDAMDRDFVARHTAGLEAALAAARKSAPDIDAVAWRCELSAGDVRRFYQRFAATGRVVSCYSQGLGQSSSGTDKINALINCHLATGRIGRPGATPLSLTGQPNAMGGREVGGLANQLAAHREIEDPEARRQVQDFWNAPAMPQRPGLKAVELFDAVAGGRIKALWIMATNPAVSLPEAGKVRRALRDCFVVVSDCVANSDTARLADVLLPAATWGEKDGTVTNSVRLISRQRPLRPPPGEARPDWWIVCQVARAMGFGSAFAYNGPAAIFREHAALSALNRGRRLFDLSALADLSDERYERLKPLAWPVTAENPRGTLRLFVDRRFPTPDGRARFVAVTPRPPVHPAARSLPFVLNSGRVRDHWHTLTRTGAVPSLSGHDPEPFVEVNPHDAAAFGLEDGGLAEVAGPTGGAIVVRVRCSYRQRRGSLFVPMHWNGAFAARAWVNDLVPPVIDPVSGQPESKHAPAAIRPFACDWYAFVLCRKALPAAEIAPSYWCRLRAAPGIWRYELAGSGPVPDWERWLGEGEWVEYRDTRQRCYRGALLRDNHLEACLCLGPDPRLPARRPLIEWMQQDHLDAGQRAGIVALVEEAGAENTVCACFQVTEAMVRRALDQGAEDLEALGRLLGAGGKCGACRPELEALLRGQ
ncbi:assimilatory nitrate reductase catalytic subunit [Methylomarinovum tepidoasis]|uniref:Assimilatory nitrate reductase catalytic subunit n=1 Tax=Methylomarinovum tepidoasis TaxID=2840183 RepID=A0AAU9BX69_9GAMM|nr:nitrate reductase [Methylomarinovum sp. IN45]BCX88048.1 assimilatory nitrate reductase catalytic subunit [Methylomarinovum sp. IN45]